MKQQLFFNKVESDISKVKIEFMDIESLLTCFLILSFIWRYLN